MSTYFSFTVPNSKEQINPNIKRFVIQQSKPFEIIPTKDGTVYQLEFNSEIAQKRFQLELDEKFPNLYY